MWVDVPPVTAVRESEDDVAMRTKRVIRLRDGMIVSDEVNQGRVRFTDKETGEIIPENSWEILELNHGTSSLQLPPAEGNVESNEFDEDEDTLVLGE